MLYRCSSCGGNVVYNPKKKKMVCESCGNEGTQQVVEQKEIHVCNNCGGTVEVGEHALACQCPYCQTHLIFEDRMEEAYKPDLVIPFSVERHDAEEILRENFKGKLFLPQNFLSSASLESMKGIYVPFWLYDFHTNVRFEGEGDKVRTWREGDYECTETKVYRLIREFEVDYDKIPVDASVAMDDGMMDLLEPYKYKELDDFSPEFLSGFQADTYEEDSKTDETRAVQKADKYSEKYLQGYNAEYAGVRTFSNEKHNQLKESSYSFLPVWKYTYRFNGSDHDFFVNGQTGKVIGKAPISKARAVGISALTFASIFYLLKMILFFLEVL